MMTPKAFGVVDVDPPAVRFFFTTLIVVLLSTNRSLLLLSNSFGLQHAARALTLVSKIIQVRSDFDSDCWCVSSIVL